jgi:hypothetical protein
LIGKCVEPCGDEFRIGLGGCEHGGQLDFQSHAGAADGKSSLSSDVPLVFGQRTSRVDPFADESTQSVRAKGLPDALVDLQSIGRGMIPGDKRKDASNESHPFWNGERLNLF